MERASLRLYVATGLSVRATRVYSAQGFVPCADSETSVGCANLETGAVQLSRSLWAHEMDRVCLHELMHLTGAGHVRRGVLAKRVDLMTDWITADDLAEVCAFATCAWRRPEPAF